MHIVRLLHPWNKWIFYLKNFKPLEVESGGARQGTEQVALNTRQLPAPRKRCKLMQGQLQKQQHRLLRLLFPNDSREISPFSSRPHNTAARHQRRLGGEQKNKLGELQEPRHTSHSPRNRNRHSIICPLTVIH